MNQEHPEKPSHSPKLSKAPIVFVLGPHVILEVKGMKRNTHGKDWHLPAILAVAPPISMLIILLPPSLAGYRLQTAFLIQTVLALCLAVASLVLVIRNVCARKWAAMGWSIAGTLTGLGVACVAGLCWLMTNAMAHGG